MSENNYKIFWNEAIRLLKQEGNLGEQEYDMWFHNISFVSSEKNTLLLTVPSNFYRDQMEQRYVHMLEKKLHYLTGSKISIEFQIVSPPLEEKVLRKNESNTEKQPPLPNKKPHSQLREEFIFETFVVGNNNSFATRAAQAISGNPGGKYNPFLIYGGVGLGKTHLMQAIGNVVHYSTKKRNIVYITAETFINEFINSIRTETQNQFKNKYRKVDILLIDDIHDLQNKKETQEELFHTFNALYDAKKQLVFTCDRPPSELKNFTDRLKSRFENGLNVDLQPPNFETRYAILKRKLERTGTYLSEEVIDLISKNVTTNVRDLESSLTKMTAYGELVGKKITVDIARQQLKGTFAGSLTEKINIGKVQRVVSEYFNISTNEMKGKKRTKQVTFPRQIAMYIIRELTDYSTTEIGLEFGGRDHTTVMHSCQKIEDQMKSDPTLEPIVSNLIRTIKESE